eukprot:13813325-Ditylum_brightwellii.AAC.1
MVEMVKLLAEAGLKEKKNILRWLLPEEKFRAWTDELISLRELMDRAQMRRWTIINQDCLEDIKLMVTFLEHAAKGVNLNLITYHRQTHTYQSDSCPHGLGGYSHKGWEWRFYLPEELLFHVSNYLLEHLAV